MDNTCRPIQKLERLQFPRYMIFFDTESYILVNGELKYIPKEDIIDNNYEHHILRLGVLIYVELDKYFNTQYRETYYFNSSDDFWNYVESKTCKEHVLYIYAHNAKYDTLNVDVISQLDRLGYSVPFPTINNAFIISAKKGKKKLKIVDTFNYVRQSVEKIGESVGVNKIELGKKGEVDFNKITDKELFIYCENDTHIIELFILHLIKFLYENDLGSLKFTTASTALNIYRHKFINNTIYFHRNKTILKLERSAYRGGIVECFALGKLPKDKYYLLDINSMYVSIMSSYKLPLYPIMHIDNNCNLKDMLFSMKENYIIADILIKVKSNNGKYGVKYDNKLIFPVGTYRVSLHQPEIETILKNPENKIIKVFSYSIYHYDYCLNDYAVYFSELKKNSKNKVDYDLSKLFGNSLYGKFGMRKYCSDTIDLGLFFFKKKERNDKELEEFIETEEYKIKIPDTDEYKIVKINNSIKQKLSQGFLVDYVPTSNGNYQLWNGKYTRNYTDDFTPVPFTNVALAGAVTANARILLSKYIEIAGKGNIYYTDTDSLMVNQQGYDALKEFIDDKELGKLKNEFTFNTGKINAPKNYIFINKKNLSSYSFKVKHNPKQKKYNLLPFKHLSIIIKRRFRSKGIPNNSIVDNGVIFYMRFTSFKEYLKSGGELKGRIQQHKINSLDYKKGDKPAKGEVFTKPFQLKYVESGEKWQNEIVVKKTVKKQKQLTRKKVNKTAIQTMKV